MWELDHKEGWGLKNWCFWAVMLEKTLESPLDARRSNQSILKEINPEYSLEGLMLKLKLQYFGHLMRRASSLETLMMGKIESRRRRGWQRIRWLDDITNSQSLLKLMSIKSVMPSDHLILCWPLLLLPSILPSIRVFSKKSVLHITWSKYQSFSFSIGHSNEYSGLISFRIDWFDLLASKGLSRVFSNTTIQKHQLFVSQLLLWPNSYIHTWLLEKP